MSALHARLAPMLGLPVGATDDTIAEAVRRLALLNADAGESLADALGTDAPTPTVRDLRWGVPEGDRLRVYELADLREAAGLAYLSPEHIKALADAGALAVDVPACWGTIAAAYGSGQKVVVCNIRVALAVLRGDKSKGET